MIYAWTLRLILALAATEAPPAPWADGYAGTALEIAQATQDPIEVATLVAVAWEESRFKPDAISSDARGRWQTSPHWGPPTAATALRLVRLSWGFCGHGLNGLAWYTNGGPNRLCALSWKSAVRMRRAAALLRDYSPPDVASEPSAS